MPRPTRSKTSAEEFIKAVMRARTLQDAAKTLGVSRQAVSKRLMHYKSLGIKGLPDFVGKAVDTEEVQRLVNKHRRRDA